jgi:hypothetical protein
MIKISQSIQDYISPIINQISKSELQPNQKTEIIKLIGQYISGQINQSVFMSNPSVVAMRTYPSMNSIMKVIHDSRQQFLQEQRNIQQRDATTQSESLQLDRINQDRRSKGLNEFQTLQEALSNRDSEKKQHQSAVKNLYKLIAMGDGDAILESGVTYAQVKEAIDNIINRSPSPRGFDDSGHHEEGVSEYLRSMYGIIDSNEKVYSFFMNAILSYHSRKENIKNRQDQERQSKIDEAHARRRESIARNREINEDRASLSQSENRARDARLSRVNQQAQINQQRRNQNFSTNRQNFS